MSDENEDMEAKINAVSKIASRAVLASQIGSQYEGDRDIYEACGYERSLGYDDFLGKYRRQDIAKNIVDKPVTASWKQQPDIKSDNEDFLSDLNDVFKKTDFFTYASRADKLSRIGEYSLLFLGFPGDIEQPVDSVNEIRYVSPYSQGNSQIEEVISDKSSEDYGFPAEYTLGSDAEVLTEEITDRNVHADRVIHIADELLENELFGLPSLMPIFNRLDDLQKIAGSVPEAFWSEVKPVWNIDVDKDVNISEEQKKELDDKFQDLVHDLRRSMQTQGAELNKISADIQDPSNPFDVIISLISSNTIMTKRQIIGSERGELASSQDQADFYEGVQERRENHCEDNIIRPFIERLQSYGVVPEADYEIKWPSLFQLNELEQAERAKAKTKAMKQVSPAGETSVLFTEEERREAAGFDTPEDMQTDEEFAEQEDQELREEVEEISNSDEMPLVHFGRLTE